MKKRAQKILLSLIILSLVVTSIPDIMVHSLAAASQKQIYNKNGIIVDFKVNSKWENGFEAQLIVTNTSSESLENWRMKLKFDHEITNLWDGEIESQKGNIYIIKYPKWNTKIVSGSKSIIGFNGKLKGNIKFPSECSFLSEKTEVNKKDYTITYKTTSNWADGFNGEISIKNNTSTTIEGWTLEFDFDKEIKQFWTAKLVKHENNHYIIKNDDWNSIIKPNQTIKLGFEGKPGNDIKEPINYQLVKAKGEGLNESEDDIHYLKDIDKDYDFLYDFEETMRNTDPENPDSDGDGLIDGDEALILETDPLKKDTDENGIMDGDEDFDKDGLNNLYEMQNNLNAFDPDSDGDGLNDYVEFYQYKTSPWLPDTDEDGMEDADELEVGFDPNKADTDSNGIMDGNEKTLQKLQLNIAEEDKPEVDKISVELNATGNVKKTTQIRNIYNMYVMASEVSGLVGIPIDIESTSDFDSAKISFHYQRDKLGDAKEDNLAILWYNEKEQKFTLMDNSILDKANQTVSLVTTHFSTYLLVDKIIWQKIFDVRNSYRSTELFSDNYNVALVIDSSQSMRGGKLENVKSTAKWYIDNLRKDDQCSVINYVLNATLISPLTNNKSTAKKAISSIKINDAKARSTLNTSGIVLAIKELSKDKGKNKKAIILFCDSIVDVPNEIINQAKSAKIRIFTVHVGKTVVNEPSQLELSKKTIGEYYEVQNLDKMKYFLEDIHHLMEDGINTTDTDNDGLYDIYELKGMLVNNVRLVKTNHKKIDSDNDGITDFNELTVKHTRENKNGIRYVKYINENGIFILDRMFSWSSNPMASDTDGDGVMDKVDPAPLVCMCGKKRYLDVTVHKMILYGNIKYMCSHCKYAVTVPELQDKEILTKKDLALMKSYTIYYTHYVALRTAKKEKIESEEEKILLNAMEDIRAKKNYETKYDYKGRNGCYQKRFSYKTKKYKLYADTVLISEKNILYYSKLFWTITSELISHLGFMGYICTLIGLGANEEADSISIVRAVISSIPKPAKEIRMLQWLITAKEIDESRLDKEVVKGDYVVRIVLDSSWATATAHNVEQKVLEVFYDKNINLKKYHFVLYQ